MKLLSYARLVRIPNVFTAVADITLAALAAGTLTARPVAAAMLMLASASLYCAGMVWNDIFDFAEDQRDRPSRPLPSGKIAMATARRLGIALLVAGFALAGIAGWAGGSTVSAPLIMSALLIVAILLYDGWLKQTPIGPIAMGSCRFLNILLGMSLAEPSEASWPLRIHLAAVIGVYIAGVTWFARRETGGSERWQLRSAAVVAVVALLMALALPLHRPAGGSFGGFPYLLVAFGFVIGSPAALAIAKPEPANIQTAIKRCILGLIVLDAVLATVFAGPWGLLIMMLLPPAIVLGRRVYST